MITPRRASVAAAATLVGAVVSVAAAIRRRRRAARAFEPAPPPARRSVVCACGREFEVAGVDRHRVYWPAGAPESEPVLGDDCPACGAPLPAEREAATAPEVARSGP
jgi:hypothetical protein